MKELYFYRFVMICLILGGTFWAGHHFGDTAIQEMAAWTGKSRNPIDVVNGQLAQVDAPNFDSFLAQPNSRISAPVRSFQSQPHQSQPHFQPSPYRQPFQPIAAPPFHAPQPIPAGPARSYAPPTQPNFEPMRSTPPISTLPPSTQPPNTIPAAGAPRPNQQLKPPTLKPISKPTSQAAIEEIMQIRKQLGGGVSQVLSDKPIDANSKNTSFDPFRELLTIIADDGQKSGWQPQKSAQAPKPANRTKPVNR